MTHLAEILEKVREALDASMDAIAGYLGIPPTTYKSYHTRDRNPKHEFYNLFKTKFNIDLETSMTEEKICFFGSGEDTAARLKAAKADLHYHIPVYTGIPVQDIKYDEHTPITFIIYPATKPGSICVRIEEEYIICHKTTGQTIAPGKKYLVVMRDGQVKILTSKHIDKDIIKSLFLIKKILSEEEMISRKIENLFQNSPGTL